MLVAVTDQFLEDLSELPRHLERKCRELIRGLGGMAAGELRSRSVPGWRLHQLRSSPFVSLSLDMNVRVLADMSVDGQVVLHRVVKHEVADRAHVNRNVQEEAVATVAPDGLIPVQVHDALMAMGVPAAECERFRGCQNDDDLVAALLGATPDIAQLVLSLYEVSALSIPRARFRFLDPDVALAVALREGDTSWRLYLHPSQAYIVDLPAEDRVAVVGSAGSGKTVCAWHRSNRLVADARSVGFVASDPGALEVSQKVLATMAPGNRASYYLVPKSADELIQLAHAVDHVVVDEGQEISPEWWRRLGEALRDRPTGLTLFYDVNQLGGNIERGDTGRYRDRITRWRNMVDGFPGMRRYRLSVNFRNSREIAEFYLELLAGALPARPIGEVPAFEAGEVAIHPVTPDGAIGVTASTLRQLLSEQRPGDIGVALIPGVVLPGVRGPDGLMASLAGLGLPVTGASDKAGILVRGAAQFRGHERPTMIVIAPPRDRLTHSIGNAVVAYIAMSRAVAQLIILEVR